MHDADDGYQSWLTEFVIPAAKRARLFQIRAFSHLIRYICSSPCGVRLVRLFAGSPVGSFLYRTAIGYNRPFDTLAEAAAAIAAFGQNGHTSPDYFRMTRLATESARLSDYPVMFYLQTLMPDITRVFDFGGHVGNMFYCYARYLNMPTTLSWIVYDLAEVARVGRELATQRNEGRLEFTQDLSIATCCDIFLASGSAHYFQTPLSETLHSLPRKPKFVILNRSPLLDNASIAAVQDGGAYRVACVLHNKSEMISEFRQMGYELIGEWSAPEHTHSVPAYPEFSVPCYSGMFWALAGAWKRSNDIR